MYVLLNRGGNIFYAALKCFLDPGGQHHLYAFLCAVAHMGRPRLCKTMRAQSIGNAAVMHFFVPPTRRAAPSMDFHPLRRL